MSDGVCILLILTNGSLKGSFFSSCSVSIHYLLSYAGIIQIRYMG